MASKNFEHVDTSAKKVIVEYGDGRTVELEKGAVIHLSDDPENAEGVEVTFDMIQMTGEDLTIIVSSIVQLCDKLGLFRDIPEDDDD